jgi:SAM-dependent methyltransferase
VFDTELARGLASYNDALGEWWYAQAENRAHQYAYRNIAGFIRRSFPQAPRLIVDYACGPGSLLSRLAMQFTASRLIGIDGSRFLLNVARGRLMRRGLLQSGRISLWEKSLPCFDLPRGIADLVVFAFPNVVPSSAQDSARDASLLDADDAEILDELSQPRDSEIQGSEDLAVIRAALLRDRLVSLNMRHLLRAGGFCVRIEYGNARREELPQLELMRTGMEEGSLDCGVNGRRPAQWFRVVASCYFRSTVMDDVYQQTGDPNDRTGGYFITVLRAI